MKPIIKQQKKGIKIKSFHGSKSFGFWNDDEAKTIYDAVKKEFGKCKPRLLTTVELM